MRPFAGSLPLVALTIAAACVAPGQSGGVVVRSGAADRLRTICRWRHGDVESSMCGTERAAAPARVRRIAGPRDRLSGALAIGRDGDYLLENDEVAFVIDQLGRGTGFAESGGNVVDAADARARRDELGQLFTYFGTFPRQAVYERLESGVDGDGTAWIRVVGHELFDARIAITTRYALQPGARALVLETELANTGSAPTEPLGLGDAVQWGATHKVAPGKPLDFKGESEATFLAGIGSSVAYALAPLADDGRIATEPFRAASGTAWTNATYRRDVALGPGARVRYARLLAIAPRGDTVGVRTELFFLQGGTPGAIEIELVDARGAAVQAAPGMRALLGPAPPEQVLAVGPAARHAPADAPLWLRGIPLAGEVPPGHYVVSIEGGGRTAIAPAEVDVAAGDVARVRLAVTDPGRLTVRVTERDAVASGAPVAGLPAKIQILDAASGAAAMDPVLARDGAADVPLAAGRYRVVASRGPEYAIAESTVDIAAGATVDAALAIERVVDTRGFVACDFHQHTAMSADSGVAMADRVLSNVAEGVECAASSEHNVVVDFASVVQKLGLEGVFRSLVSEELTSDASKVPFGHANVFPMPRDPADARGGALAVRDRTAKEVFDAVRALPGDRVLQVNHPRAGRIGYFDQLAFDRATGRGTGEGYDERFDALEVWSGRHADVRPKVLDDYWALLRTAHPVTPTANTDTHGIVDEEAGYPRTYVAVPDDDPARLDPAAVVAGVKRDRRVVLTNGPFVTLQLGPALEGGLASRRDLDSKRAEIVVTVERAPWIDASELVLIVGGQAGAPIPLGAAVKTAAGALRNVVRVPVRWVARRAPAARAPAAARVEIAEDTFIAAIVSGKKPLEPVLHGAPDAILPFAMTAPIWVDADGDGRALGR